MIRLVVPTILLTGSGVLLIWFGVPGPQKSWKPLFFLRKEAAINQIETIFDWNVIWKARFRLHAHDCVPCPLIIEKKNKFLYLKFVLNEVDSILNVTVVRPFFTTKMWLTSCGMHNKQTVYRCQFQVTFWRKKHLLTKNMHLKCWWNWLQVHIKIGDF